MCVCVTLCVWCVCVCVSARDHVFVTTVCCAPALTVKRHFPLAVAVCSCSHNLCRPVEVLDVSLCEPAPSPQQIVTLSFLLYRGTLHLPTVKKAFGLPPDTLLVTQLGEVASIDVGCHDNTNKLNMIMNNSFFQIWF